MRRLRYHIVKWLLRWLPDLIIDGCLPARIGRYRVVDTLLEWSASDGTI